MNVTGIQSSNKQRRGKAEQKEKFVSTAKEISVNDALAMLLSQLGASSQEFSERSHIITHNPILSNSESSIFSHRLQRGTLLSPLFTALFKRADSVSALRQRWRCSFRKSANTREVNSSLRRAGLKPSHNVPWPPVKEKAALWCHICLSKGRTHMSRTLKSPFKTSACKQTSVFSLMLNNSSIM